MMCEESRTLLLHYIDSRGEDPEKLRELLQSTSVEAKYSALTSVKSKIDEYTAVHRSAKISDLDSLKAMLHGFTSEQQYDVVKIRSKGYKTALHWAAYLGHTDIIMLLMGNLSQEQRINLLKMQDGDGSTPLHSAANGKHPKRLKIIATSVNSSHQRKLLNIKDYHRRTIADLMPLPEFPYDVAAWTQLELDATNKKLAAVEAASNQQAAIIEQLRVDFATQRGENARFAEKQNREKQQHTRGLCSANQKIEELEVEKEQLREELNSQTEKLAIMERMMEEMLRVFRQTICIGPEMNQEYEADLPYP